MSWMNSSKKLLALGILSLATSSASAAVWKAENEWNDNWDARYADFIRSVDTGIFNSDGRWGNFPTDCADAAYGLRIIFAYENKLPVQFNTWDGSMTNKSSAFDDISDPVKRVRKFIARVGQYTDTGTISNDTYPIAVRAGVVRAGAMFVHPPGNSEAPVTIRPGHIYIVRQAGENGILQLMSSTVPIAVRDLNLRNNLPIAPMTEKGGFRAWNRPFSDYQPNYSTEQFSVGGWYPKAYRDQKMWIEWIKTTSAMIGVRKATAGDNYQAALENINHVMQERITAVNKAWRYYQNNYGSGQCMSEGDYDDHSTPSRDTKIQTEINNFEQAAAAYANKVGKSKRSIMGAVRFEVLPGIVIDMNQIKQAFFTRLAIAISEPEHSPEVRWGLREQGRWPCPHRAKTYLGGDQIDPY